MNGYLERMYFFSKKRGEKFIKAIFSALKHTSGLFVVHVFALGSALKILILKVRQNYTHPSIAISLVTIAILCVLVPLHAYSEDAKSGLDRGEKRTTHLYPGSAFGPKWSGAAEALLPDLTEEALYQKFNARNSAYIPQRVEVQSDDNNSSPVSSDPTSDTEQSEGEQTEVQEEPVAAEQQPAPIIENSPEASEPISLRKAPEAIFAFLSSVTDLFPFAQEIQTEELPLDSQADIVDTVETEAETNPSEDADEALKEETSEAENGVGEETSSPTPEGAEASTEEPLVVTENTDRQVLAFTNFELPALELGEAITSAQLRMSVGAKRNGDTDEVPSLTVIYKNASTSEVIGSIEIEDEVSNAFNGGYALFAIPEITSVADFAGVTVEIVYEGKVADVEGLYVDALWFEIETEKIDVDLLREKTINDIEEKLVDPKLHTLLSPTRDFTQSEFPQFSLKYIAQRNVAVRFVRDLLGRNLASVDSVSFIHGDVGDIGVTPKIDITADGLVGISLNEEDAERLKPGEYTLAISINEGGVVYEDSFSFQWGMLSVNSNQTTYELGEVAAISLGALSPNGNTVCDALLNLFVISPTSVVTKTQVLESGLCNGNNVIDVPDYSASFTPTELGEYEMYVERVDQTGTILSHTSDTFKVVSVLPLKVLRDGPSRIYPRATYPMEITVKSAIPWNGVLIERVPGDFVVSDTNAKIQKVGDEYELHFDLSFDGAGEQTFSYTFDAPDISPFIYNLGSARLVGDALPPVTEVNEPKPIAEEVVDEVSDDTSTATTTPTENDSVAPPSDLLTPQTEPEVSVDDSQEPASFIESLFDAVTVPFVNQEEAESDASVSHPPQEQQTEEVLPEPTPMDQVVGELEEEVSVATTSEVSTAEVDVTETVAITSATTTTTSSEEEIPEVTGEVVFEEHRQWQIASDATGSMIAYWTNGATVPAGWTCLSCGSGTFYQKFVRGGAVYNSTGGATTHTHTAGGAVAAASTANSENRTVGGLANVSNISHSHTYTPNITASTTLPAYRNLRVIQNNSAGEPATVPAGVVMMFDSTLPTGWIRYTALDNRYPRGETAIANAGTSTHRHTIGGSVDAASGSTLDGRNGGTQVTASAEDHTHVVSSNTGYVNHEPPFISVIFATSSSATNTPTGAVTMWTDTPPAQWQNASANVGDAFNDKFIKGSVTYGTTGGSDTHTHANVTGITSGAAVNTQNARTGATGANSTHTHSVDVTTFTTTNHLPPYVTAIFGRKYGPIPLYTQSGFKFYVNNNTLTPTDAWPLGGEALLENEVIDAASVPVKNAEIVRLRIQLSVSNSTSTSNAFKLQFASTTAACTSPGSWSDVGNATSSALWRGYNNAGVADGATLSSSTISGTDVFGSYEETNPSVNMPNTVGIGSQGEWDFVLQHNGALEGTNYCFKMVRSDGSQLYTYSQYPMLVTNEAPNSPSLSKLFDNEKVGTTTPDFEFSGSDNEIDDLTYQIQVDDDYTFASVNIDRNSVTNSTQFENLATPADKDPFTQGELISFNNTTALTNGTTYYWRVRAKDPNGSNSNGNWSTIRSFTIDTSVTFATWFQTTDEQFDTNVLSGVDGVSDQAQLRAGSTTGTMYSDPITFSEGLVGTAWGTFSFADTETSSDLKYTIQYNNGGVWTDIPDSVLAGNVAGFDTSPVSLLGVNKTVYDELRIEANFVNSGASPSLQEWTVNWSFLIETPTITAPFSNEKVATTTPTFQFSTTDPQGDSLQYQIQWSTTYAFTASTTRNSNINAGFTNVTSGGDLDPFNSGNTIRFKIQSGDALTNGTTYWWRVRARDPLGSNTYSFFTDPRSITVDTAVTVSTWFQTTQSQFAIDSLSNAITRSTNVVTVATTTQSSLIAYAEGTVTTPRYRTWDGSLWSAESSALDVGATIVWSDTKASPIESEYVLATMGTDADVNVQVFSNGTWSNLQEVTINISNTNMRGFDVAYEQISGDAMVVTCDGDANPSYWIWNGSTWTNNGGIGLATGNTCGWVKLISDPLSDEIIAITRDTSGLGYESRVWDGSTWGNSASWGSMNQVNHEGIAAAYEDSGGQAVVAVSNGTASSFSWRAWTGAGWGAAAAAVTIGDDFESGTMVSDDGTDNMGFCYIDEDGDIGVMRWGGASWNVFAATDEIETTWTTVSGLYNDQPIDCMYEVGGARDGLLNAVYSDRTNTRYRTFSGGAWVAEASVSTLGVGPRVHLSRTGTGRVQAMLYSSSTDSYNYADWNGTAWSATLQTLENNASIGASPFRLPFMIAPANPSILGTVTGEPIDFYEGSGPYWQQMSWVDTTGGSSNILYQVEYYDGDSWELIPNTLIPGNSVGTTTSPINLTNVLPASTYDEIRPVANMICNAGTCPSLSDWNITWAAGITISGTAQQYNQSTNVTSGTVAVALNGVVQIGKTGTIAAGVWSIANVNAAPGDIVSVFVTGAADAAEAVAVTKYDGVGNISGMNLFERHLSIGSADNETLTNAHLGLYDFTNTEDVFYDVDGGSDLNACATTGCGDVEIIIKAGNVYQPGSGGDVRTNDFENNGTLRLNGNMMRLMGSWDNNATTTLATSTVHFIATSTSETIDETGAVAPSFNNLTLGQSTSTATWTLGSNLDVNGTLSTSGGTFARGTRALALGGNFTNGVNGVWTGIGTTTFDGTTGALWNDASVALQNIGKVVIDGTLKTVTLGDDAKAQSLTIGSDDTFDASSSHYDITVFRNWINNNTFTARQGTVFFAATTTGRVVTAGGDNFYDVVFSGIGGAWSFTESVLGVGNDFSITAAGTVALPTGTTTVTGSFTNSGGTFAHNNSLLYFTSGSAETLTFGGTTFTNGLYNVRFTGAGSWSFTEPRATTTNTFRITQGNVTLPSATLTIGDTFTNSGGTFTHNSGTVKFIASGSKVIDTNSSFNSLLFTGSGSFSFLDGNVTALGSLTVSAGTLTLPSGTFTLGGSLANTATLTHNSGTVLFNSTDTGESISLGTSPLFNMTFNSGIGGWTITNSATSTNNVTLTAASAFTLSSGRVLSVGNTFTNSVGGAATTWTGSTLSLEAGAYSLNTKANTGDTYGLLRIDTDTDIKMWNSSATTYGVNSSGSLYSQDHNAVDGDLYIFGSYGRTSGTEFWSYTTDFDGTALGGSPRQVDVRLASAGSVSLSTAIFNVTGISSATTTVANQGAGTYTIGVSGGTTTASYYDFRNLGASGISLSQENHLDSLGNGFLAPGVGGGTTLTISSSTIDANPGEQIFGVNFSTTSVIVASNVTQVDGAPTSYWWFRNSRGSIDGESFDFDSGNPGTIRWDNSSLAITISGVVYQENRSTPLTGGTCNGVSTPVRVVVEGGASYTGTCSNVNGSFSIPGVAIVGDPTITVYLDGASGGDKAVTVTKTATADITNLHLYKNHLITRHEDVSPLTIEDMYYDSGNDSDVFFTTATGTTDSLIVNADRSLFIFATSTFTPGGLVTLRSGGTGNAYDGSLYIGTGASFVASTSATTTIGGSFVMNTNSVFTHGTGTVLMTATTSGKGITVASGVTADFNILRFNGVGGGWNLSGSVEASDEMYIQNGTVTGTANISVPFGSISGNGVLSLGGGTTTIARSNTLGGTTAWTFHNLVLGNGSVVGTTTPSSNATTTIGSRLTLSTAHYLDAGSSRFDFTGSGTVFVENGTFLEDTSTVRYSGGSATNLRGTAYYNLDLQAGAGTPTYTATGLGLVVLNDLTIGGSAPTDVNFTTNDTALDVNDDILIRSNGTFVASNSGIFTVGGDFTNDGTFTSSGGLVTFDSGTASLIAAGNSSFGNVTINGAGSFTVSEHATTTGTFSLTTAGSFTLASGQVLSVGGVFTNALGGAATTWTGSTLALRSGTNYQINAKTISDAYATLIVGANTDIRMWNSSAATYTVNSSGSLYSQDHNDVAGDLYMYGNYPGNGGTDFWSYAIDFDGVALGGGSRQVDVRLAGGASADILSGGLQVLGTASASTSIQNQGSGTYAIRIGGNASTTWSYYDVEDMNSSGLTFSGSPTIINLSRGDFEVTQSGGSAITVGGSVINANPAKTFTNNIFATTSAITAFNVTATGTSVSSWRFTNHTGNLAGETKDSDPDGDPGYLVWDNSASNITIGGNVYSDEGVTVSSVCDGATNNVHLRVAGLTSYTTSCNAGTGAYTINGVTFSPGDSMLVYIDGETEKAATVTEDPSTNVSNMHLYENRVIVRHEGVDPLSILDMSVYDSSEDADIPFTAIDSSPDTLTVPANRKLLIWTGKTFAPGGNTTISGGGGGAAYDGTLEAQSSAALTLATGQTHSIGGSFIFGAGAVFTPSTATTTFTTTGAARTIDINNGSFFNVSFTGSGSWTVADVDFDAHNVLMTAGTLTLPSGTSTIAGSFAVNGGSFVSSGSRMLFTATDAGNVVKGGGSNFADMRFTGAGSWSMTDTNATTTSSFTIASGTVSLPSGVFSVGGSLRNVGGTITHNTSEIVMRSASAATIMARGSSLSGLTIAGAGPFTMSDGSLTLVDDFRINTGSITLATSTLSVGGSFVVTGGTFAHASGTVLFNATSVGKTINPSTSSFHNVVLGSGTGGWTIAANATTTRNFALTSAASFTQQSGTRLAVRGVFTNAVGGAATTWTGSTLALSGGTEYAINSKVSGGDNYQTLILGANTDISSWDSRATTTTVALSSSFYSQDHGAVSGALNIYGDYHIATGTRYWSYANDFDGTALGGSPRAVTVRIAAGATTTVDGGSLAIVGALGNETTVTNQGSGLYEFVVSSGTFNAQYYRYRNLNSGGLTFTGSPSVTSLSYGDFELAVSSGNLITLATTTLDANASMLFTGNRFATTTAITGTNVALVGTTSNAWTFIAHTGNLDGEAYDNDGVSACGSIRWSDSACLLTQQTHYRWRNDDGGLGAPNTQWFNGNWNARKSVRVNNADATTYSNAVVKLDVAYDADMQTDFDDLRFTNTNGTTSLSYFIDRYTGSTDADVWVKIPSLAAGETKTIYMYFNHPTASSTSSSGNTFIANDDFEDGNDTEYSGDVSLFTVDGTFAYSGAYGLDTTGNENARATDGIARFDETVSQGQIVRYIQYIDTSAGDASGDDTCTLFGVQSPVTANQNYAVCLTRYGTDKMTVAENVVDIGSSGTILSTTNLPSDFTLGWHEVEIDWNGSSIGVELRKDGTLIATSSVTDSSYTTGGIGFTYWFQHGGWDNYTSRPRVDTEPSVLFGTKQVDGGASWRAALDTPVSYSTGDVARLRLAMENTGLLISGQTYEIEFAEKGASPSCEAVSGASYVTVPPSASCGSSPLCMATSTNVTDGAAIADLLTGPEIAFVLGEATTDPANTADALSLNQDEYTELEYALRPTINATDPSYCVRVTNAGDPVDTYLKVAEMQLQFDPVVTNVSINSGAGISLLPGATTTVYATGTVTDLNGPGDLVAATSTFYRSGVAGGAGCTANNNDCYIAGASSCTFTSCAGFSCTVSCEADFYYHADATDDGPYIGENWLASIEVVDGNGVIDIGTVPLLAGVELFPLRALDVTSAINYVAIEAATTTGTNNSSTTVVNLGNMPIDIDVVGTDMLGSGGSYIPASEQKFGTSTFNYNNCVSCSALSSTTPVGLEVDLFKPTSFAPVNDLVYWGLRVPFGVGSGFHQGSSVFTAVSD